MLSIREDILQARLQIVADKADAGGGPSELQYYAAPRAASVYDPPAAPPLAVQVLETPCGVATPDELELTIPTEPGQVLETGTIAWARWVDRDGDSCIDMDVAADDLSGTQPEECLIDNVNVIAGGFVYLVSAVFED